MKRSLLNLLVLAVSTVLGITVLEFAVRALFPWYDPARQVCFYVDPDGVNLGRPHDVIRQRTPKGDYDLFSRFNQYGFRDAKDFALSGRDDIFVLGDSFSFGWGVADGQRYSDRLEALLGRKVYNISIPGDLLGYQKLLQYARSRGARVSALVLGLCVENDLRDYSIAGQEQSPVPKKSFSPAKTNWRGFLKSHSAVYLAFSYELQKIPFLRRYLEKSGLARDLEGRVNKNVLDEKVLASSLEEIMKILRSVDSSVVLIIPSRMLWTGEHHLEELAVHQRLIELLRGAGAEVVDMRPLMEKGGSPLDYYFKTDPHWNKEGHDLAAQALAAYFREAK